MKYRIGICSRCGERHRIYFAQSGGIFSWRCRPCIDHDKDIWKKAGRSGNPRRRVR